MSSNPWVVHRAVAYLRAGGVIAYPTETIWGLGCDPLNPEAVLRLLALKRRSPTKGLILVAGELSQLQGWIKPSSPVQIQALLDAWPVPVTWLFPAQEHVPPWIRGQHHSVAVRLSTSPLIRSLCRGLGGALVSTSANISGRPVARNRYVVRKQLGADVDYIVPSAGAMTGQASQIRDAITGKTVRL